MKNIPPEMKKELKLTDADQEYFSGTKKSGFGSSQQQRMPDKFSVKEIKTTENIQKKI